MKEITLKVKDLAATTVTNADAVAFRNAMGKTLAESDVVILSFHGVTLLTTSFLNSSIGEIADEYGIDSLKNRIKITQYTPSVGAAIKRYIENISSLHTH